MALEERLRERIRTHGPLPFDAFMEAALYDPDGGFYARAVPGEGAGYETAPTLSPAYGACLARALDAMREALGAPPTFTVVEYGPGRGDLAAQVLSLRDGLEWVLVEPRPLPREAQRRRLDALPVRWESPPSAVGVGCVLANEVLDNLPFELWTRRGARLLEGHVDLRDDRLEVVFLESSRPAPEGADGLEDDEVVEVRPAAGRWIEEAAGLLGRGYVLVVDYGYDERPPDGTALAYRDGVPSLDLVSEPGTADITAHVDVPALVRSAERAGLRLAADTTQRRFLLAYGLREELEELRRRSERAKAAERLRLLEARSAAAALAAPSSAMARFRTVVFAKDAPDPSGLPGEARELPDPPPVDWTQGERRWNRSGGRSTTRRVWP